LQKFLELLNRQVMTKMSSHLLLTDLLSSLFTGTGEGFTPEVGILALSSLFILMRKYGINQDSYYDHLYRMLRTHQERLFSSPHSTKLKKLLEISLRSNKVSLAIVCAFVKLLMRVALRVRGCDAVWIVAFVLNLFIKNPSCQVLLKNCEQGKEEMFRLLYPQVTQLEVKKDGFDMEAELGETKVFDSKLWELLTLKKHF